MFSSFCFVFFLFWKSHTPQTCFVSVQSANCTIMRTFHDQDDTLSFKSTWSFWSKLSPLLSAFFTQPKAHVVVSVADCSHVLSVELSAAWTSSMNEQTSMQESWHSAAPCFHTLWPTFVFFVLSCFPPHNVVRTSEVENRCISAGLQWLSVCLIELRLMHSWLSHLQVLGSSLFYILSSFLHSVWRCSSRLSLDGIRIIFRPLTRSFFTNIKS